MTVELLPETEQLLQEEIQLGHFASLDEVIVQAVQALREKSSPATPPLPSNRKTLYNLLSQPPFAGSDLNLDRQKDFPKPIDL
jgi:Arc/MetJ-type ribon-helix-helix transcriptional regulator